MNNIIQNISDHYFEFKHLITSKFELQIRKLV